MNDRPAADDCPGWSVRAIRPVMPTVPGNAILRLLNARGSKLGRGVPKVQTIIVGFLVGAVASLAFRVWALVPLTLIMFLSSTFFHLHHGMPAVLALGDGLLTGLAPQIGYAFGLAIAGLVLALRPSRESPTGRSAPRNPPSGA